MKKKVFAVLCLVMLLVFTACDNDPTQDWFVQTQWLRAFAGDFNLKTILADVADGGDISIDYSVKESTDTAAANEYLITIDFNSYEIGRYSRINDGTLVVRVGFNNADKTAKFTLVTSSLDVDMVLNEDTAFGHIDQTLKLNGVQVRTQNDVTGTITDVEVSGTVDDFKVTFGQNYSVTLPLETIFRCGTATTTYENKI